MDVELGAGVENALDGHESRAGDRWKRYAPGMHRRRALLRLGVAVGLGVGGCGSGGSGGEHAACLFDACPDEVSAQAPVAPPGHTVSFTVCRSGQCASGTLLAGLSGTQTALAVSGADCNVSNVTSGFGIWCFPRGTALQSGEVWSMWAGDDGPAGDGGVSASSVLLDVTKAIVVPAASGGACASACHQVLLN